MRILALPPSLLLSVVLQARASAALDNDFSAYPQGSQQCLSDSADQSKCSGSTGQQLNECLCSNQGNFIYNTAQCVAKESPNDLDAVYDTMENNCAGTGVTIAVSKSAFMSQAQAATATSSSATPSATATSVPNNNNGSNNNNNGTDSSNDNSNNNNSNSNNSNNNNVTSTGMSTAVKIGLAVGVSFGAIALGLLAWFVWAYSRRRRNNNNRHSASPSFPPSSPFPPSSSFPSSPYPPSSTGILDPNRDVELSHNYSTTSTKGYSGWPSQQQGMTAAEWAQHNGQFERAELDPNAGAGIGAGSGLPGHEWKELPADYYSGSESGVSGGGMAKHDRDDKRASSVPLLAELGGEERTRQQLPVELPADNMYNHSRDDIAAASPASSHGGQGHEQRGRRKGQGHEDGDAG